MKKYESWELKEDIVEFINAQSIGILIISGASGSGKSYLSSYIDEHYDNIRIIKTYTTRKKRINDDKSMVFLKIDEFKLSLKNEDFFLWGSNNDIFYGYKKDELVDIFNNYQIPLFMFHYEALEKLIKKLNNLYVIFIHGSYKKLHGEGVDLHKYIYDTEKNNSLQEKIRKKTECISVENNYDEKLLNNKKIAEFLKKMI